MVRTKIHKYVKENTGLVRRISSVVHLVYFALVTFGGPYHFAAGTLLVIGIIVACFHLEGIE